MDWVPRFRIRVVDDELYADGRTPVLASTDRMPTLAALLHRLLGLSFAWVKDEAGRKHLSVSREAAPIVAEWEKTKIGPASAITFPFLDSATVRIRSQSLADGQSDVFPFELTLQRLEEDDSVQQLAEAVCDTDNGRLVLPHILVLDNYAGSTPRTYARRRELIDILNRQSTRAEEHATLYLSQAALTDEERNLAQEFVWYQEKSKPLNSLIAEILYQVSRSVVERQRRLPPMYRQLLASGYLRTIAGGSQPVLIHGVEGSRPEEVAFQIHRLGGRPQRLPSPIHIDCRASAIAGDSDMVASLQKAPSCQDS